MKDKFLIGELSKLFNISSDTLRHYDRIDLLKPHCDNNNYRYYSIRDFFKLSRILFLKNLDISLEEIKKYMRNKNTESLLSLLKGKEEEIDLKINRLLNLKNKIKTKLELLESIKHELDIVKVKVLPKRVGVFLETSGDEDGCYIKQAFKENKKYFGTSSWLIEGQIYTSISKENLEDAIYNKFRYFVEMVSVGEEFCRQLKVIHEGEYACIAFLGPYRDMEKHYKTLIRWIEDNGYVISGDSIEKNIIDYDFSDLEYEYVSEIQIPIRKK